MINMFPFIRYVFFCSFHVFNIFPVFDVLFFLLGHSFQSIENEMQNGCWEKNDSAKEKWWKIHMEDEWESWLNLS